MAEPLDLERLRELLAKATPGPWRVHEGTQPWNGSLVADGEDKDGPTVTLILGRANNDLIVAIVNAAPTLLRRLEAAELALDAALAGWEEPCGTCYGCRCLAALAALEAQP